MDHFQKLLRQPDFFRLWLGQIISSIGDRFYQFALLSLVLHLNEGTQIGKEGARVIFIGMIPGLIFAPLMGMAVDRFNRKATLIFADLSRVVLVLALIYIWFGMQNLVLVYVVIFFMGGMNSLFIPARQAALPQIVAGWDLITANALMALVGVIASLVGVLCAEVISSIFGARLSFILTAVGFSISALLIFRITASLHPPKQARSRTLLATWDEIAGGWNYVRKDRPIQWIIVLNALFAFVSGFFVISVLQFAVEHLDQTVLKHFVAGATDFLSRFAPKPPVINVSMIAFGILMGSLGLGLGLGIVHCGPSHRWVRSAVLPFAAFFLIGIVILIFPQARSYEFASVLCFILGWGSAIFTIPIDARLQTEVPDACRGRVFALRNFCTSVAFLVALGFHLSGGLLRTLGPSRLIAYLGAGMIVAVVILGMLNRRGLGAFWGEGKRPGTVSVPIS